MKVDYSRILESYRCEFTFAVITWLQWLCLYDFVTCLGRWERRCGWEALTNWKKMDVHASWGLVPRSQSLLTPLCGCRLRIGSSKGYQPILSRSQRQRQQVSSLVRYMLRITMHVQMLVCCECK